MAVVRRERPDNQLYRSSPKIIHNEIVQDGSVAFIIEGLKPLLTTQKHCGTRLSRLPQARRSRYLD